MRGISMEALLSEAAFGSGQMFITEADIEQDARSFRVRIPPGARIATTRDERWVLADKANPRWRWSAGGALVMLHCQDAAIGLLQMTEASNPVWPRCLTAATGLANGVAEWLRPRRLLREAFEEIIIATPQGLIVPHFGDEELDSIAMSAIGSATAVVRRMRELPERFSQTRLQLADASLIPLRGEKDLVVEVEDRVHESGVGLPVIDPSTRGIDIMSAVAINLPGYGLDDIAVLHGEWLGTKPADSEIVCVELDGSYRPATVACAFKTGRAIYAEYDLSRMTPVLRQTLDALS